MEFFALVRNGHARGRKAWAGADRDRPLNARGRQQALGLVESLGALQPARLLSSPAARCRQTLDPLALHTGTPVIVDPALSPKADVAHLDRLLASGWADGAVLCTHGRVLRELLRRWETRAPAPAFNGGLPSEHRTEKGAAWLVVAEAGARTLHYFRPLHVGPVLGTGLPSGP